MKTVQFYPDLREKTQPIKMIGSILRPANTIQDLGKQSQSGPLTCYHSDSRGPVSQPPEESQADVLLHPLPFLQHAQNVLL